MDRRAFLFLTAASMLQPESAAPPPGSPDTPGGPDLQTAAFQAWLRDFMVRAIAAGWPAELVTAQMAGVTVNQKVVDLDTRQPELVQSTGDYVRQSVTDARVTTGRRDIWGSSADALASAGNLMMRDGWRRGEAWAREVILPADFDYGLAEGPKQTPGEWAKLGARRADGLPFADIDKDSPTQLILPAGAAGPAFLIFPNHMVIRRYNNSTAYALSVGLLADRISGMGPLSVAWPIEPPLSTDDRIGAQKALAALGFDPGAVDGVIGVNTRVALRGWQKARGLPADGHLTQALSQRVRAEASALSPTAPPPADTPSIGAATPH